jgi:hypothetical protein
VRCLIRSVFGFYWNRIWHGGRLLFLSGLDQMEFKAIVSVRSHQINCIKKSTALAILFDFRVQRLRSSLQLLRILKFERLAKHLLEFTRKWSQAIAIWRRSVMRSRSKYTDLKSLSSPDGIIAIERGSPTFSFNMNHDSRVIAVLSGTQMRSN